MAYKIEPVTYTDAPGLADTMMRAMNKDPRYSLLLNGATTEELIADTSLRLSHNLTSNRYFLRHQKVISTTTTTTTTTGKIVGYARCELPENETETSKSVWLDVQIPAPTQTQQNAFKDSFDSTQVNDKRKIFNYEMEDLVGPKLGKVYNELVGSGGPYLVLDYMVCHPEHHRKGIASLLLANGEIEARKMSLKIFVMTSTDPGSAMFYEKRGFTNLRPVVLDVEKWGGRTPHGTSFLEKEAAKLEVV